MERIIIVGAGGHGQVVADILWASSTPETPITPIGFLDDDPNLHGKNYLGVPVLGFVDLWKTLQHDGLIVAIGDNRRRAKLQSSLVGKGARMVKAIHPSAILGKGVTLGQGAMVCAGAVINPKTKIGFGAIINTGATVDHHNDIGDFVHIAPGCHLAGEISVGEGAFLGIGSSVLPGIRIGEWAVVGAGAAVTRDVKPGQVVAGVPARVLNGKIKP